MPPTAIGQELPKKIRGYKVHSEIIILSNESAEPGGRPSLVIGSPVLYAASPAGATVTLTGHVDSAGYEGRINLLTFQDFQVNGVSVDVEEIDTPFKISKREKTSLPVPAKLFLPARSILNAAWNEIVDPKEDWTITGRVFVFGKFKKFGFSFERVVPIDVRLIVKNPLLGLRKRLSSQPHQIGARLIIYLRLR